METDVPVMHVGPPAIADSGRFVPTRLRQAGTSVPPVVAGPSWSVGALLVAEPAGVAAEGRDAAVSTLEHAQTAAATRAIPAAAPLMTSLCWWRPGINKPDRPGGCRWGTLDHPLRRRRRRLHPQVSFLGCRRPMRRGHTTTVLGELPKHGHCDTPCLRLRRRTLGRDVSTSDC